MGYSVKLDNYEGPLDLLLKLIEQNRLISMISPSPASPTSTWQPWKPWLRWIWKCWLTFC